MPYRTCTSCSMLLVIPTKTCPFLVFLQHGSLRHASHACSTCHVLNLAGNEGACKASLPVLQNPAKHHNCSCAVPTARCRAVLPCCCSFCCCCITALRCWVMRGAEALLVLLLNSSTCGAVGAALLHQQPSSRQLPATTWALQYQDACRRAAAGSSSCVGAAGSCCCRAEGTDGLCRLNSSRMACRCDA